MRGLADAARIRELTRSPGEASDVDATCYPTGGVTAVLVGWRATTVAVDIALEPDDGARLRELPRLEESLRINVELVSARDFIPLPDGWRERSPFVAREGKPSLRHFDPISQALAKLERGLDCDLDDVRAPVATGLVDDGGIRAAYDEIEPSPYRFPAIDPRAFRRRVEDETE